MSDVEMVDGARDYRLMSRKVVDSIISMREYNRYSKGLFTFVGFKTKWISYENIERVAGKTKWSFWKLFKYALEGITAFSTAPLIFSSIIGLLFCLVAFLLIILIIVRTLVFGDPTSGWPSMVCIIFFVSGVQLFSLGIIGQYMSKSYLEIKHRPIYIIRETEKDEEVIPNLMAGFEIDEIQADYIAEIKLRNLNKRYILDRLEESEKLEKEINELKSILDDDKKVKNIIISELKDVIKKYGEPRKTQFFYPEDIDTSNIEETVPEYPCTIFLSKSGYFKKITPQSLRMASEQKYKEGDDLLQQLETNNNSDVLFFTSAQQVYKSKLSAFEDTKASLLGDYVPAKLAFDSDEDIVYMANTADYSGYMIYIFENGKIAKVPMNSYETKTNRKKLNNAYSDKSKLIRMFYILADTDIMIKSTNGRAIVFNTSAISEKSSRTTQGVQAITLKAKSAVEDVFILTEEQKKLQSFVMDAPTPRKIGLLLGFQLGLRIGEICGLKWGDFDLSAGTVTIQRTVTRISCGNGHTKVIVQSPKTQNSHREIPLPKSLLRVLKKLSKDFSSGTWFLSGNEEKPVEPRCYRKSIYGYLKKASVHQAHPHALRHTFATTCLQAHCDIKTLSELLGHADAAVTLKKYVHSDMTRKRKEINRVFENF